MTKGFDNEKKCAAGSMNRAAPQAPSVVESAADDEGGRTISAQRALDFAAQEIISLLQAGTPAWKPGWEQASGPLSAATGRPYRGFNAFFLTLVQHLRGYGDNRWITRREAVRRAGRVKPGEIGWPCLYFTVLPIRALSGVGRSTLQADSGESGFRTVSRVFLLYNLDQTEGVKVAGRRCKPCRWEPLEAAETMLDASGAHIRFGHGLQPAYDPRSDEIRLPLRGQFESKEAFYDAALHELAHWTGHPERLNRPFAAAMIKGRIDKQTYAREELCAEIASFLLATRLGLAGGGASHAAYVASWLKALAGDMREVVRAASRAQAACEYLFDLLADKRGNAAAQRECAAALSKGCGNARPGAL